MNEEVEIVQREIEMLFARQQQEWEQLRCTIEQMKEPRLKRFAWGEEHVVYVQLNPARMTSVAAKSGAADIGNRPCLLCEANRPMEQKGISFLEKYIILCNPYPIIKQHLTIALHSHVPQRIRRKMGDMLTLAQELSDYIIFYNGAKSGASIPEHFHFQAGLKSDTLQQGDNELRSCMVIESESKDEAVALFEDVYQYLHHFQPDEEEPMMSIVAFVEKGKYRIHVFPRKAARPKQYFAEGAKKLLITPGALDMAGLFTVVREEDFEKVTQQDIEDIYAQVSRPVI
jgi:hypothetical protein